RTSEASGSSSHPAASRSAKPHNSSHNDANDKVLGGVFGLPGPQSPPPGSDETTVGLLSAQDRSFRGGVIVAHSMRTAATEPEEVPLGARRCHGGCPLVGGRGLVVSAQPAKQVGSRGVERVVVVQVQLVHQSKRRSGALHLADGDGAVEGYDRRGGDRKQLVVEGDDLRPVGLLDCRSVRMHGVDGGLELIRTGLVAAKALAEDRLTLLEQGPIPASAVLLAEQHEGTVGPRSRRATGLAQE